MKHFGRLHRVSLLTRFCVVGLLLTVAVGVALSAARSASIADRAREQVEDAALMAVRLGLQPQITPEDLAGGNAIGRPVDVQGVIDHRAPSGAGATVLGAFDPIELMIVNRDRTIVYHSRQPRLIGRTAGSGQFAAALAGDVVSRFAPLTDHLTGSSTGSADVLEVYVPLQYPGSAEPAGVIELHLPYAPVAAAVREDVWALVLSLVLGLAVFYVVLVRVVATASRRLQAQAEELRVSAQRAQHQATHDALTGQPNWSLVRERLDQALVAASRSRGEAALIVVDLDRFKEINDTLGHSVGNRLLCQVGPRMQEVMRAGDTVARLGGDEFAVLLPSVASVAEAGAVAERLREALHRRFDLDGLYLDVEASVGVAVSPWHGTDTDALLRNADVAMYVAKERKAGVVVFSAEDHVAAPIRLTVLGDLRDALDRADELFLAYQPKIALDGEHVEGVEALLRWQHPTRGTVLPGEFIPVAEGAGIIVPLTERVLHLALTQQRCWLDAGHAVVPVAVNLSTRCLLDSGLPELVGRLLAEHRVPAGLLRLEVTESAMMLDATRSMSVLGQLHDLGVRLSIDDFGTGYSSMAYLRRLPVDELKIDRSFVMGMTESPQDAVLVRTAIDLGHNLGLTVVAEGVETAEHVAALRELGCDVAQGYFFARPMPAAAFAALLGQASPVRALP